jgi:flagellar biosynthesis protein FlhF
MRIKTFYAKNMKAALQLIKEQMGPDALIVSSREFPPPGSGRAASGFEVVAAVDEDPHLPPASSGRTEDCGAAAVGGMAGRGGDGDADTYSFRARGAEAEGRNRVPTAEPRFLESVRFGSARDEEPEAELRQMLLDREVSEPVAGKLLEEARALVSDEARGDVRALRKALATAARDLMAESAHADGLPRKRLLVLLGPTGVGKTTSIAKLAARLALRHRKKVALLSLDGYRIGAVEQLRTYAGLMGMPFRFVRDAAELTRAVEEFARRDFILVDTIGHGPRNLEPLLELGRFLETRTDVERHLVLSAATKPRDFPEIAARFACCHPDHLLFTKLDETGTLGPILSELVRTGKPLAYYSDGQRVPEDFHAANREGIVDLILN